MSAMMTMAGRLVGLRRSREWSQRESAERSKVSEKLIREMERGRRTNPTLATLAALADAYECSIDFIAGRETS